MFASPRSHDRSADAGRPFDLLWAGAIINQCGNQVAIYATPLLALTQLGATASEVALLAGTAFLPYLIFGLVAGDLADRADRRVMMLVADLARASLTVLIPVLFLGGHLTVVILGILVFAIGSFSVVSDVAFQSTIPELLAGPRRNRANSNLEVSRSVVQLIGPGGAGLLIQAIGASTAFFADALTFICSAALTSIGMLLLRRVPLPEFQGARTTVRPPQGLLRSIGEGLSFSWRSDTLRTILLGYAVWVTAIGAFQSVAIALLTDEYGIEPSLVGAIYVIGNSGFIAGATVNRFTLSRFSKFSNLTLACGLGMTGFLGISLTPPDMGWALFPALLFISSLAAPIVGANFASLRQEQTPDHMHGRVASVAQTFGRGMVPVGAMVAAVTAMIGNSNAAVGVAGALSSLAAIIFFIGSRRDNARRSRQDRFERPAHECSNP